MLHVGLTGGLASGKSTVAALLAGHGGVVVDADRLAREVVEPGTPGLRAVVAAFGEDVLLPDGSLDRPALGRRVFGDDAARAVLNGIVHPLVREASAARVAELPDDAVVVHDVPLIVENGMAPQFHLVVVVAAPAGLRLRRAVARGLDEDTAAARIAAQADDDARHAVADVWLPNEGDEDALRDAVATVWRARLRPFADNLRSGTPAASTPLPAPAAGHGTPQQQVERLVARLRHVAGDDLAQLRYDPPAGRSTPFVLHGVGRLGERAAHDAGFVPTGPGRFASADPGRPAELALEPGGD